MDNNEMNTNIPENGQTPGAEEKNSLRAKAAAGRVPLKKPSLPVKDRAPKKTAVKRRKRKKTKEERAALRKKRYKSLLLTFLLLAVIALTSLGIIMYTLSCVNDVLAMNRATDKITVSVRDGMDTDGIIDLLKDKGLIKNAKFCKFFNSFLLTFDEDTEYIPGVYELTPSMGLEVMLTNMSSNSSSSETVTLTFPEGYTADQILKKLEDNKVCSANAMRQTMKQVDFSREFTFLPALASSADRYVALEGYLFPDTYEFYLGENCSSVIKKFLENFETRWSEEYSELASSLNMTPDQILTLASIIEKEAYGSDQMYEISGVLHNRLNDTSGSFKYLGCDSTSNYINNIADASVSDTEKMALADKYDTNERTGLPTGPICNPGLTAIEAALKPEDSDYFYFCHDKNSKIYLAETEEQHNSNYSRVVAINSEDDD